MRDLDILKFLVFVAFSVLITNKFCTVDFLPFLFCSFLVLRESLHDVLDHLLPWDTELFIDDPVDEPEEEPEVQVWIIFYSHLLSLFSVKTSVWSYNLYHSVTPFFSYPSHFFCDSSVLVVRWGDREVWTPPCQWIKLMRVKQSP